MHEIIRTNNVVLITVVEALFKGANIRHMVADQNASVMDGSVGILPRRVLVAEDDAVAARRLLVDAGLAAELRPDAKSR